MTISIAEKASTNNLLRQAGVDTRPAYFQFAIPTEDGTSISMLIEADFFSPQGGDPQDYRLAIDCPVCRIRRKLKFDTIGGVVMEQPVWDDTVLGSDDDDNPLIIQQEKTFVRGKFVVNRTLKDFDVLLDDFLVVDGEKYGPIVTAGKEPWTCPACVEFAMASGDSTHIFSAMFVRPGHAIAVPGTKLWHRSRGRAQ